MKIGIPKEPRPGETRVAATPVSIKKLIKKGYEVVVERGAGVSAHYLDQAYQEAGATLGSVSEAFQADIVLKINKPSVAEILQLKKGALVLGLLEPYQVDGTLEKLAEMNINAIAMELIPRTSRAQSMDVLSSQAGIAGYRAVIEAASHFGRFFPMMMTSAGSVKACQLAVLGAGVAGLQAIATARKLGAVVEGYDVRPEVREQIESLGAKFMDLDVGEQGSGQGGYAKELSEEGKRRQQAALANKLKSFDIIISTANVPGRKAPVLIAEEAVKGMRAGSVIVDMAAQSGGNCLLTECDKVVVKNGVTFVGVTNFPARAPTDASHFFAQNYVNLIDILWAKSDGGANSTELNLTDDIVAAALVVHKGALCRRP
jgi:H+-translocating NAD(P) transhydrogenase subunit alpha